MAPDMRRKGGIEDRRQRLGVRPARILTIGSRFDDDHGEYPDIDMKFGGARYQGRVQYTRKDGTPY